MQNPIDIYSGSKLMRIFPMFLPFYLPFMVFPETSIHFKYCRNFSPNTDPESRTAKPLTVIAVASGNYFNIRVLR
jgi:hypothetical protein